MIHAGTGVLAVVASASHGARAGGSCRAQAGGNAWANAREREGGAFRERRNVRCAGRMPA